MLAGEPGCAWRKVKGGKLRRRVVGLSSSVITPCMFLHLPKPSFPTKLAALFCPDTKLS